MADESPLSAVIDDDGQLFGYINVIDALAILLTVAVLAAGIALVGPLSSETTDTRYATIDVGAQPEYIATQITDGDQWVPQGGGGSLTVEEAFVAPRADGQRDVIIRAAVNGTTLDPTARQESPIQFAGEPLRFGRTMTIETNEYVVEGTVTDIETTPTLGAPTTRAAAIQIDGMQPVRAQRLAVGMTELMAGEETATITNISNQPATEVISTNDGFETVERPQQREVTLTMTLTVREREDGTVVFRGKEIQVEDTVTFEFDGTTIEGEIANIGS